MDIASGYRDHKTEAAFHQSLGSFAIAAPHFAAEVDLFVCSEKWCAPDLFKVDSQQLVTTHSLSPVLRRGSHRPHAVCATWPFHQPRYLLKNYD